MENHPEALGYIEDLVENIDHVAVAVENIDEAIRWYSDGLGFRLVERRMTRGDSTAMVSAVMRSRGALVILVQGLTPESQVSRFIEHFGPGVQHIALAVTDIDKAVARLHAAGGDTDVEMIEEPGIRQSFLRRDSRTGVRVELIERSGGRFTDRSVERLFRALESQDLY